jgi:hypothetical protein
VAVDSSSFTVEAGRYHARYDDAPVGPAGTTERLLRGAGRRVVVVGRDDERHHPQATAVIVIPAVLVKKLPPAAAAPAPAAAAPRSAATTEETPVKPGAPPSRGRGEDAHRIRGAQSGDRLVLAVLGLLDDDRALLRRLALRVVAGHAFDVVDDRSRVEPRPGEHADVMVAHGCHLDVVEGVAERRSEVRPARLHAL